MGKKYVSVMAEFDENGRIMPRQLIWDDGRKFSVDKITDIRRAASTKAGGVGMRYRCLICGHERYLFLEENRWFVEI